MGPMQRDPQSHKGENGKVLVIGGSRTQHGAPIFSALAAQASGVDLIFVALPSVHADVAKNSSLNFQVHPFGGESLKESDVEDLLELLATMDAAVIGPGLGRGPKEQKIIRGLIESCPCTMVLDASALQSWTLEAMREKTAILTPHLGELERLGIDPEDIEDVAKKFNCTILAKGPTDRIASSDGRVKEIAGGNAGLTVGGTGDALAGLTAGLIAQKMDPFDACVLASRVVKRAGEALGSFYTTHDVIRKIPELLKN